ncbi:hypothetical protein ACFYW1_04160 [Streptomyces sp. NPDC002669]
MTGRARLPHRRAEEISEESARLPANPLAGPNNFDDLRGGHSTGFATVR